MANPNQHHKDNNHQRPADINDILGLNTQSKPKLLTKQERFDLLQQKQKSKTLPNNLFKIKSNINKTSGQSPTPKEHNNVQNTVPISTQTKSEKFAVTYNEHEDTSLRDPEDEIIPKSLMINPFKLKEMKVTKKNKGKKSLELLPERKRRVVSLLSSDSNENWEQKSRGAMTSEDWKKFNKKLGISSYDSSVPPIRSWYDEPDMLPSKILDVISGELGFKEPSTIQKCSIPNILSGTDFLGVAKTGSGKTLAYVIPLLVKSLLQDTVRRQLSSCYSLILCPTRELAQQIEQVGNQFDVCDFISIVGGRSVEEYSDKIIHQRRKNFEPKSLIIVATPGRLIDCLDMGIVQLDQLDSIIYDEADKMVDFGFEDQLDQIHAKISNYKFLQKIMFTATLENKKLENLVKARLFKPNCVKLQGTDDVPSINQFFEYLPKSDQRPQTQKKFSELCSFLKKNVYGYKKIPIIIFVNYKKTADALFQKLVDQNYKAEAIHGSKSQDQRERILQKIKTQQTDILIGTDVAARGIDIPDVAIVINYELGSNFEEYIHRIGRTGRGGKSGESLTFLCEDEFSHAKFFNSFHKFLTKRYPKDSLHFPKKLLKQYQIDDYDLNKVGQDDFIVH
ncbi:hypothetical protein ACO0QE_002581 [Hanseniaspora vineae]